MTNSVLIVEDNQDLRGSLESYLKSEGLAVFAAASAEEGIDFVDEEKVDIAIVDINLPGKSGFDLVEHIREEGHKYPLLAMTARDGIDDKLRGFNIGLTDYIVKPFDIKELYARLMVHLQNSQPTAEDSKVSVGNLTIDPKAMQFKQSAKNVELTQIEFNIMLLLMRNKDTVVDIDDVINFAWGESENLINPPIRIHIANLRKKIGDDKYEVIRTIPGKGYILDSEKVS